MQTELISLSKAFTENLFRIPDYQRGYSWGERQLKEFWSDVEQLEDGASHYTGVLTLEEVPKLTFESWEDDLWIIQSKSFKPYFVVDGQQRLTTAIVLITAVLERVDPGQSLNYDTPEEIRKRFIYLSKDGGISRSYIFGYEKDNPSYEFLKTEIFGEQSDKHSLVEPTIYTANLSAAKSFFDERLRDFKMEDLERIYTKITQSLLFNVFTISEGIDVHVTFETMNNRGKPLSQLELLKNRLIYLSTKLFDEDVDGHDRASLRRTINESWKAAYHYLGRGSATFLSDDYFLEVQALCYFSDKLPEEVVERRIINARRYGEDFDNYLLDEVFNARRVARGVKKSERLTAKDLRSYALDMKKVVEVFYKVLNPGEAGVGDEEKIWLERIRRQEFFDATPLIVEVYKARHSAAARVRILKALERFLFFRGLVPYYFYNEHALKLRNSTAKLASKKATLDEITSSIEKVNEQFKKSKEFDSSLKSLGRTRNYYRWSPTRYVLFEYEQHLRAESKSGRSKLSWEEFSEEVWGVDYVTLEHIYPQQAAVQEWKSGFNEYSVQQRNRLKNSLGNLCPLSKRRNSSLGNKSFAFKKGDSKTKVGYSYGCYSEIEVAHEPSWTPESILLRGMRLLDFMEERWGFELGEDNAKRAYLGLDFIKFPPDSGRGGSVKKKGRSGRRKLVSGQSGISE